MSRQSILCRDRASHDRGAFSLISEMGAPRPARTTESSAAYDRARRAKASDRVWPRQEGFVLQQSILCRDKVLSNHEFSCHDRMFLCRDKIDNGGEILCCERIFYVSMECCQTKRLSVATWNHMLRHSLLG